MILKPSPPPLPQPKPSPPPPSPKPLSIPPLPPTPPKSPTVIIPTPSLETKPETRPEIKTETKPIQEKIEVPPKPIFANEEAPLIIHRESEFKPLASKNRESLGGLFGFLRAKKEKSPEKKEKPIKATVEMGILGGVGPKKSDYIKEEASHPKVVTQQPKMRVVNYSDFKTPVEQFGKIKIGSAESETPKPPEPPEPPTPPKPLESSTPSVPPTPKVFVAPPPPVKSENEKPPFEGKEVIDLRTFEIKGSAQKSKPQA